MRLLHLSLLTLLVIMNGPSVDCASGSINVDTVADLMDKMKARLEAQVKERYNTLIKGLTTVSVHSRVNNDIQKEKLEKIKLKQKKFNNNKKHDLIVDSIEQLDNNIKDSRNTSQCDAARLFKRLPNYFGYLEIQDCPANPLLIDIVDDGWITFQRRRSLRISFNRNWSDYKHGFGSRDDDFWLGLETLHKMTSSRKYELRVVLTYDETSKYEHYSSFSITNERDGYRLRLGKFIVGNDGDLFKLQRNIRFSTPDRDNDSRRSNCAEMFKSGWWYGMCGAPSLNGRWYDIHNKRGIISSSEMKIREVF